MVHSHVLRFCQIMYCGCVFSNQFDLSACLYCYCVIEMIDTQLTKYKCYYWNPSMQIINSHSILRNSHSHTCLNCYVLKCLASTTMIEKLIQIYVLRVLVEMFMKHDLGSLQDFGQHFAEYIFMVKLSKEQNNAQYNVLKIVKVTCKKTLFFSVLSLFSLPLLHVD